MGNMKYRNMDEFTKIIVKGTVDRSKKFFQPRLTMAKMVFLLQAIN